MARPGVSGPKSGQCFSRFNSASRASIEGRPYQLRSAMEQAIEAVPAETLLLSGGIDSSLLAALDPRPVAITVVLVGAESSAKKAPTAGCSRCSGAARYPDGCGSDLGYARDVAAHLGLAWHAVELSRDEALAALGDLVRLLRSYDLGLLNDLPIYAGLRLARSLGLRSARTGEDADTLFGGYLHHREQTDWSGYLGRALPNVRPPSARIGAALGLQMGYPYLQPAVLAVAQVLRPPDIFADLETGEAGAFMDQADAELMGRAAKPWGKVVLRRAAEGLLPQYVVWRPKTDLQFGSGMCRLEEALVDGLTADERRRLDDSGKRFWNDAHRALFLIYDRLGFRGTPPAAGEYACKWCGAGVPFGEFHCVTCGAWPADTA